MAQASATEVFNCTPQEFFSIVSDYEKYPEFLPEVKECHLISEEGGKKLVDYRINIIKDFKYTLWMKEIPGELVAWEFAGGDLFKVMNGFWKLEEEAGKTRATYSADTKFKLFVPGPIAKALVEINLPNMMSAYHKRVSELFG